MSLPLSTAHSRTLCASCLVAMAVLWSYGGMVEAESIAADSLNWCGTQKRFELELHRKGIDRSAAAGCPFEGPCDDPVVRDSWTPDENTPTVRIRLAIHSLANSDGSNAFTTEAAAQNAVNWLNQHYAPSRIQFDFIFDQVNNSDWRLLSEDEVDQMKNFSAVDPAHWLNVWVGNVDFGYSFGTFPFSSNALGPTGGIVLGHYHWGGNFSAFAHEVGHCLGLWHNFHGVSEVPACESCYESVDATDRDVRGDFCADTPPTPPWYTCDNATDIDSCSGLSWGNTQPENYMGYTPGNCRSLFTPQQRGRMHCWIDAVLTGWISGVLIQGDTIFGKAPLSVELSAQTFRQVNDWSWDLGDQSNASTATVSHTYNWPGIYSVGVEIATPDGSFTDFRSDLVWVYDDTVTVSSASASQGVPIRVLVSFSNYVPLTEAIIPVVWSAENGLSLDSISTVGLRGATFDTQALLDVDNTLRHAAVQLTPRTNGNFPLPPGRGPVVALYFTASSEIQDTTHIAVQGYGSYDPYFACPVSLYTPTFREGVVHSGTCCVGRVGDANGDGGDEPTIGDIAVLVDMLFLSQTPVACMAEADVNQSGGLDPKMTDISIGDVSVLVDYLFITGSTLGLPGCL